MTFNLRGKYFRKLLLSAFILVLVPLTAAVFIFTSNQNRILHTQAINDYEKRIIHSASALEQQLLHVISLPAMLAANANISDLYFSSFDPINSVDIVFMLNHYCQFNSFVSDIYVHLPSHGIVYSSTMRMPDVSNPIGIQLDGRDFRESRSRIDSMYAFTRSMVTLPDCRPTPTPKILYSAPIHAEKGDVGMSISIVLDDSAFVRYLSDRLELNDVSPFACLLYGSDIVYSNVSEENAELLALAGESIRLDGVKYRIFSNKSALEGYRYVFAIPEKVLFSNVSCLTVLLMMMISTSVLFLVIALWMFLRTNYTPIHNIYATVHKYINKGSTDELEVIRDTLELLETHVEELNAQAIINNGAQRRTFLLDLMNGEWVGDYEALRAQAEALGIPTSGRFATMLIDCSDMDTFARQLAPIELFSAGNVENSCACCLCVFPSGTKFENPADEDLRARLVSASDYLRTRLFDAPGICVGNLYDELSMAPFSYMEAKAAAELQRITGESILLYRDVALLMPTRSNARKPTLSFVALARSITQGDSSGIEAFMDSVVHLCDNFEMPMVDMRRIIFDIYNAIFSVAPEISKRLTPIRTLFDLHTRNEIVDLLQSIRLVLLDDERTQSKLSRLNMDFVERYIMDHYAEHDFSIRTLAAQTGLSLPYFSQLFKKEKGVSPMDYITDIRVRCAQKLLVETDLSISEIVDQIGYYSISSFIKRFRKHTGMTPGEFRSK